MVKHTQTICRQIADELFECVWPFCEISANRDKINKQKSEVLNFFDKLKFDEKADIALYSRSMQPVMFLKLT